MNAYMNVLASFSKLMNSKQKRKRKKEQPKKAKKERKPQDIKLQTTQKLHQTCTLFLPANKPLPVSENKNQEKKNFVLFSP